MNAAAHAAPLTIRPFRSSWRRGLPMMTPRLMSILIMLRDVHDTDDAYLPLDGIHHRTLYALLDREWIAEITVDGLPRYGITGRGLKALKVYEPEVKRTDGLCPRCCERPRFIFKTGTQAPYCKQCTSEIGKRQYRLKLYRPSPDGICARCQKRPRYVASSGKVYCYCQHCKNLLHRREHKRKREDLFIRVIAGEHVPCTRNGCDRPRYVSGRTVQDYCYQHYREYQNAYCRSRKVAR